MGAPRLSNQEMTFSHESLPLLLVMEERFVDCGSSKCHFSSIFELLSRPMALFLRGGRSFMPMVVGRFSGTLSNIIFKRVYCKFSKQKKLCKIKICKRQIHKKNYKKISRNFKDSFEYFYFCERFLKNLSFFLYKPLRGISAQNY